MPNKLNFLTIHCTATPAGMNVLPDNIHQWHQGPVQLNGKTKYAGIIPPAGAFGYKGKIYATRQELPNEKIGGIDIKKLNGRGWRQVGYADMILLNGKIENLVPYNDDDNVDPWELTNGVTNGVANNANYFTRNSVYVGGMDKANKTLQEILASSGFLSRPAELLGSSGYGLPQAKEWEMLESESSQRQKQLLRLTVDLDKEVRSLLEPARAAEIAATEANTKQIGEHLRAIHKAAGGLQLP